MTSRHPVTFADLLRRYRRAAGFSQETLAQRAGLSRRAVSDLECASSRTPRKVTVELLAEALDLADQECLLLAAAATRRPTHIPAMPSGLPPQGSADFTPLVGRLQEQSQLERYLAGKEPLALLFGGEPGIGKTRLLHEAAVRAQAAGWRVLEGGCTRRSAQASYAPFTGVLAHAIARTTPAQLRRDLRGCAWLAQLVPELAELALTPAPSWKLPPEQEQRLLFASVGRYLANVAGPSGTLLVLDDLQWAGGDALDLLESLMRASAAAPQAESEIAAAPLRILGAYRDTEVQPSDNLSLLFADLARDGLATQRHVGVLDQQEARAFADLLLDSLYDENQSQSEQSGERSPHSPLNHAEMTEQIVHRAGGVPFFLVSYALGLGASGGEDGPQVSPLALTTTPATPSEQTPWQVTTSIRQRLAALPHDAQLLLGALAVAGRAAPFTVLAAMLARPKRSLLHAVEAACHARLLEEAHGEAPHLASYQFPHDLIRETVLHDLSAARRTVLHRAVGEVLERAPRRERERRALELAHHFQQSGDAARAVPYAFLAGNQAGAVYAFGQAEKLYRQALELARQLGDQAREAEALEQLAQTLVRQERNEEALDVAEQGLHLNATLHDHEAQARLAQVVADVHTTRGTPAEGVARLQTLLATLSMAELSAHGRARVYRALGDALIWSAQFAIGPATLTSARAALEVEEEALAAAKQTGDAALRLEVLHPYGLAHYILGHQNECLRAWEEMIPLAEEPEHVDALFAALLSVGYIYLYCGQFATARAYFARALTLSAQHDWLSRGWVHGNYGELECLCGDWEQAHEHFERGATRPDDTHEMAHVTAAARIWRGLLLILQGHEERGVLALEEPLLWVERHHHLEILRLAHGVLAERDVLAGRFAEARARLEPLRDQDGAQSGDLGYIGPPLAWAYLEMGDVALASATISEVKACMQGEQGSSPYLPDALRVSALIAARTGRWQDAFEALEEALRLCRSLPVPYAEAKVLYVAGTFLQAQGACELARTRFQAAMDICDRLEEGIYRPLVERALEDARAKHSLR